MDKAIFDKIKTILVDRFAVDPANVQPETDFQRDLNFDSMDSTDLMHIVNELFNARIDGKVLENIHTIGELVDAISVKRTGN